MISDPGGRYVILVVDVYQTTVVIANIYMPPHFQSQILHDLLVKLAPYMHLSLLLAGDFNAILDGELDTSNLL